VLIGRKQQHTSPITNIIVEYYKGPPGGPDRNLKIFPGPSCRQLKDVKVASGRP
jgi:hypothetical protein